MPPAAWFISAVWGYNALLTIETLSPVTFSLSCTAEYSVLLFPVDPEVGREVCVYLAVVEAIS